MRICKKCSSLYPTEAKYCDVDGAELSKFEDDPLVGTTIGKYKIIDLMGRGGCGSVYKAVHTGLNSEFAIKVLYGNLGGDENYVQRFRREAQVVSKIRSPWVVSVVDFGTSDAGLTYLVMEYCDGVGLDRVIARDGTLAPERAARFTSQIASALAVAHKLDLVHRDVKPANVMVEMRDGKEFAKLLDFGIVRVEMDGSNSMEKLTQEGVVMGTPAYMSPEQAAGGTINFSADLYSLGVLLYEMLSGAQPFSGHLIELFYKHQSQPPPPLPMKGPLVDLCLSLLGKTPADRPPSANAVHAAAKRIEMDLRGGDLSIDPNRPLNWAAMSSDSLPAQTDTPAQTPLPSQSGVLTPTMPVPSVAPAAQAAPLAVVAPPQQNKLLMGLAVVGAIVLVLLVVLVMRTTGGGEPRATSTPLKSSSPVASASPSAPPPRVSGQDETLTQRLDQLDPKVAVLVARLPKTESAALEEEYLDLYRQLQMAGTPDGKEVVGRAITRFATKIEGM